MDQKEAWENEPQAIQDARLLYVQEQQGAHITAQQLANSETHFEDSDSRASMLTRDGEMSLNVIPVIRIGRSHSLLNGESVSDIDEWRLAEELSLNTVPVPASWRSIFPQEQDGLIWLPMTQRQDGQWEYVKGDHSLIYTVENGLERIET